MNTALFTNISFPSFGIDINPPRGFSLFGMDVRFYGIVIALGLLLAVLYALKRSKQFGIKEDDIVDGVLWIVPLSVIFARAYYCAFSWEQFAANPISVLYIWEGGIAIYGAVIGAALGVVVHCLVKKIKLPALLDVVCLGFLIGQCIGRWGNFFNREAFGAETESFFRMGLFNSSTEKWTYYHPTFLYESLWTLLGFVVLHFLSKKRQYDGQIALGYVAWYGLGRTLIEGLRMDSLYWGSFRVSQLLAAVSCFVAAAILVALAFKKHSPEKLYVNQAKVEKPEKQADKEDEAEESEVSDEEIEDDEDDDDEDDGEYEEDYEDEDTSDDE